VLEVSNKLLQKKASLSDTIICQFNEEEEDEMSPYTAVGHLDSKLMMLSKYNT
jgi:hypothetical protein